MVAAHPLPPASRATTVEEALDTGTLGFDRRAWEQLTPAERVRALGYADGEIAFSGTADDVIAWLESDGACASST